MPRLYEKEWNGVSLVEIAGVENTLTNGVPNGNFYAEYYRRLKTSELSPNWKETKSATSAALESWLEAYCQSRGKSRADLSFLSIGAGIGVVEIPLIRKGYRFVLQDVQEASLELARKEARLQGVGEIRTCSGDLDTMRREKFDFVYVGTCEYCFADNVSYRSFLQSLRSLLKPESILVSWDFMPSVRSYLRSALQKCSPIPPAGVFWGVARTAVDRAAYFREAGLRVEKVQYWDSPWRKLLAETTHPSMTDIRLSQSSQAVLFARPLA